uniref:Replication origin-binding protein n=1 Tax=Meleagrid herpesvirus 1 TaxID=37108 RepID=Q9E1I1_MEHV1|nr:origin of replication binding protein [Meleagrid alphaherpesvirus 1]
MIDYASSASLSRMLYGKDLIEWIAKNRPAITVERQSDGPVAFPSPLCTGARSTLVVRAPMGSGKTTALLCWLRSLLCNSLTSVLIVSCRRSFTETLSGRLNNSGIAGFVTYLTAGDYIMKGKQFYRLLVQIESLHRIDHKLLHSYDIVILDEIMSTIGQLFSPTMKHLRKVDSMLTSLLRKCPQIVAMDATINAQLVDMLAFLRGEENIHVIIGEYASRGFSMRCCKILRSLGTDTLLNVLNPTNSKGTPQIQNTSDLIRSTSRSYLQQSTFFYELGRRLEGGLNVCIFSSTISFSEIAARFCLAYTNAVLVLNSTRDEPVDMNLWSNYRVVIYTTVVTVGLSFNTTHFHSMMAYVKPTINGPDMVSVYQSLGRIRSLRLNEVLIYMDASGARSDPIFTPMLLNHVIDKNGGWATGFYQVTNMLCRNFRRDCFPTFGLSELLFLFPRFKYKHLFERCTLNNISDSLNIIHALLESNLMQVTFDGCDHGFDSDTFFSFLMALRTDSLASQKDLKLVRGQAVCNIPLEVDILDSDVVAVFVRKYIKPTISFQSLSTFLTKLSEPIARDQFINITMLDACRATSAALYSEAVFRRIYDFYASGSIPIIGSNGKLDTVSLTPDFNTSGRWDLYRLCCKWADSLHINPLEGNNCSIDPSLLLQLVNTDYSTYARAVLEVARCYLLDAQTATKRPVITTKNVLSGLNNKHCNQLSNIEHAVSLLKATWEILFGLRVVKSTSTFPGGKKVKNLRKAEIEALLDGVGINRTLVKTHKDLYRLLMKNKVAFQNPRYEIRRPKWYDLIRSRLDTELGIYHDIMELETVLAEVPASYWPAIDGAIDFHRL